MKQIIVFVLPFAFISCKKDDTSTASHSQQTPTLAIYTSDWEFDGVEGYFTVDYDNQQYPIVYRDMNPIDPGTWPTCSDTALPRITVIPDRFYFIEIYRRNNSNTEPKYNWYKEVIVHSTWPVCRSYNLQKL